MPTKLADLRPAQTMTEADADAVMREIAERTVAVEVARAKEESTIALAKAVFEDATAEDRELLAEAERRLTAYITAHPERFRKPRQRQTDWGAYGVRKATKLRIEDNDAVIDYAAECGYEDVVSFEPKLSNAAIRKRIEDGEEIPGAVLDSGDVASYTVAKTLVERAREGGAE